MSVIGAALLGGPDTFLLHRALEGATELSVLLL